MKGSIYNRLNEGKQFDEIHIGMGATSMEYSDRHAYTVQKIISDKRVVVTRDKVTRIDGNGPSDCQEYEYESTDLVIGEAEMKCCHPFSYIIENGATCKIKAEHGSCDGCKHFKKHKDTNGLTLVKCKNGWKMLGTDTYFAMGIRDEFYDYSF